MFEHYECEFCHQDTHFFIAHAAIDIFCCVVVAIKLFVWYTYQCIMLGSAGDLPCKECRHTARWHSIAFDVEPSHLPNDKINTMRVAYDTEFILTNPLRFDHCWKCTFKRVKKGESSSIVYHEYKPFTNVEYIEWKYDKRK